MFSIQKSREKGAFAHGAEHLSSQNLIQQMLLISFFFPKKAEAKLFSLIKTVDFAKFF